MQRFHTRSRRLAVGHTTHVVALTVLLLTCAFSTAAQEPTLADGFRFGVELGMGLTFDEEATTLIGPPATLAPDHKGWVDTIFRDLVAQASRRELRYVMRVLESDIVNAFSAPGGFIYLTTGLLEHLGNDTDALANVIGHEIAHIEMQHALNQLTRAFEVGFWVGLGPQETQDDDLWNRIDQIGVEMLLVGWGRQFELEADALGQRLAAAAGYDPRGLVTFFEVARLVDLLEDEEPPELPTHPPTPERIQRAQLLAGRLEIAERRRPKPTPPSDLPDIDTIIEQLRLQLAIEQGIRR